MSCWTMYVCVFWEGGGEGGWVVRKEKESRETYLFRLAQWQVGDEVSNRWVGGWMNEVGGWVGGREKLTSSGSPKGKLEIR